MNYIYIHSCIINAAKRRDRCPLQTYESHHIHPRCEGGLDDGPQVWLTPKEHRIVHKLRYKITGVLGNKLAYNLMRHGRPALAVNHQLISKKGGHAHHALLKQRSPQEYHERQSRSGKVAGRLSRDNSLGFHSLTPEQRQEARDRGRQTTVKKKLGMFSDAYRAQHRLTLQKHVTTPDRVFDSMTDAAEYYGVSPGTITYRVKSTAPKWMQWSYTF